MFNLKKKIDEKLEQILNKFCQDRFIEISEHINKQTLKIVVKCEDHAEEHFKSFCEKNKDLIEEQQKKFLIDLEKTNLKFLMQQYFDEYMKNNFMSLNPIIIQSEKEYKKKLKEYDLEYIKSASFNGEGQNPKFFHTSSQSADASDYIVKIDCVKQIYDSAKSIGSDFAYVESMDFSTINYETTEDDFYRVKRSGIFNVVFYKIKSKKDDNSVQEEIENKKKEILKIKQELKEKQKLLEEIE